MKLNIRIGSIWLAADGGSYGHVVTGVDADGNVAVKAFNEAGWTHSVTDSIDSTKLLYRYKVVHIPSEELRCPRGCGRTYTEQQWECLDWLQYVGTIDGANGLQAIEVRRCGCSKPIARKVALPLATGK